VCSCPLAAVMHWLSTGRPNGVSDNSRLVLRWVQHPPSESVTTILHPSLAKIRALASVNRMLCCFILTVKSSRSATIWYAISLNPNSFSRISEPAFGLLLLTSICWEDDY